MGQLSMVVGAGAMAAKEGSTDGVYAAATKVSPVYSASVVLVSIHVK